MFYLNQNCTLLIYSSILCVYGVHRIALYVRFSIISSYLKDIYLCMKLCVLPPKKSVECFSDMPEKYGSLSTIYLGKPYVDCLTERRLVRVLGSV